MTLCSRNLKKAIKACILVWVIQANFRKSKPFEILQHDFMHQSPLQLPKQLQESTEKKSHA